METKKETKSLLTHFTITTMLMGAVFVGADVVQTQQAVERRPVVVDANDIASPVTLEAPYPARPAKSSNFIESMTLVNESLPNVLSLLEKWTNKILIVGNNLPKATFNLNIPMPLSKDEAVSVLKSLLSANGIAVVPGNDKTLRVVPNNRAKSSSPEIVVREVLKKRPASQEICACLFRLENLTAREGSRIIMPLLTPLTSSIVTLDKANSLFITDMLSNLQQLDRVLEKIDKVGAVRESILFFYPKNASAESLKANFENLQNGALKCYILGNTSFSADKNTNLFTVVTPKGNEELIRTFVAKLDVNVDPLVQHHVFRIQHGSAKDTTELIKKLVQQEMQVSGKQGGTVVATNSNAFSPQLSLECDERLNAIVACGTPSDIRQIQNLVNQLDVILPQVRIEVIIAEVTLNRGQASGLESFGYTNLVDGVPTKVNKISVGGAALTENPIFNIKTLNFRKLGMDMVINAAKLNSNISILSSPTLLTTHAREALLKITETRPYLSSVQTKTSETSADISNSTIEKVDAGIELVVKPLIGTNGMIQMEIDQKVDSFSTNSTNVGNGSITLPYINRREAKSFVSVQSGEMIILAGLKKKELTDTKKKMFLLGELPFFGDALFNSKSKQESVTEMIIFIRPYLLTNGEEIKQNTETYEKNLLPASQNELEAYRVTGNFLKEDNTVTHKRRCRHKVDRTLHGKRLRLRQNSQR